MLPDPMADAQPNPRGRFGTFGGVFTPCTLTILGVIMFLRFGQVVGNSGVWMCLGVIALAKLITTLTAFSVSSIATNTQVKGGGAYFMISRSLGVEFGGSIGLVFFMAQAVSVAMYVIGFTEAFVATFPSLAPHSASVASTVNLAVFICVFIGAGWTIKLQYGILAVLVASLVSFAAGAVQDFDAERLSANLGGGFAPGESFFTMFALFFPAATGIMAGANMSGDLKDPARSIPRGTLGAIGFTGLVYAGMAVLLAGAASRDDLLINNLVVRDLASVPLLITGGIFAATLSSAIGSMMGAPRILQAVGRDGIFRRLEFFGIGAGVSNEPRRAVVATFVIAQLGILVGDLDLIAPIITMFFMVTYGYLNLATFVESYTKNPSYRPTFRLTHWSLALLAALACAAVMFLIAPLWAAVAIAFMALLHWWIARRQIISTWGDVHSGVAFERARKALMRMEEERYHPKNWRPAVIAFSGSAGTRTRLAVIGHWLCSQRGILTLAQVISGEVDDLTERRRGQERALRSFIQDEGLKALHSVIVSEDRQIGMEALVQCHGLGALTPNTVLAGWSNDPDQAVPFIHALSVVGRLGRSLLLLCDNREDDADPWGVEGSTVDVWWRGKKNGPLMLLLAHLLMLNEEWRGQRLRLLRVVPNDAAREESVRHLTDLLATARMKGEVKVIASEDAIGTIRAESRGASVVFLGLDAPREDESARAYMERSGTLTDAFRTCVLVGSAGDVSIEA